MPKGVFERKRPTRETLIERLENHATQLPNGCLISKLRPGSSGYALYDWPRGWVEDGTVPGRKTSAHRAIYMLVNARYDIARSQEVMHSCDRPLCINSDHLSLGTHTRNMRDCVSRKRHVSGLGTAESHVNSKLNSHDVRFIRAELAAGKTQSSLAANFRVDPKTITAIRDRRTWKLVA